MSVAALDVRLANQALALLGSRSIQALDEGTGLASIVSTLYGTVRDDVLSSYPWRSTLRKARLPRLAERPIAEWSYAYALPADLLVLRGIWSSDSLYAAAPDYELYGDQVHTQAVQVWADYQARIPEALWPAHVRQLFVFALTAMLAIPVTEQTTKADFWEGKTWGTPSENRTGGYARVARTIDSQQQPPAVITDFPLISARFGG